MSVSTFLNGRAATQLRGLAFLSLSETCHVLEKTFASDGGGGGTTIWGTAGTAPCRVDPVTRANTEQVVADRLSDESTHRITIPAGVTSISVDDRVEVVGRGLYEVTAVPERTGEPLVFLEALKVS